MQKSSVSRVCAVGGFFISIPIFLTGIILYTFTQFQSTPAIVTSALIGVGIVFCGGAMVHNVFVWQKEKTICVRQGPLNLNLSLSPQLSTITPPAQFLNGVRAATATPPTPKIGGGGQTILTNRDATGSVSPATLDVSNVTANSLHELSTLV